MPEAGRQGNLEAECPRHQHGPGAREGIRTPDLLITSELLYH